MSAKTEFIKERKHATYHSDRVIQSEVHKEWCRVLVLAELEEWEVENSYTNKAPAVGPQIPFF